MLTLAIVFLPGLSHAADALPMDDGSDEFSNSAEISDSELDTKRGGFINVDGMQVSFAYAGLATVNGAIVATSSFNSEDFAKAAQTMHQMIVMNDKNDAVIQVMHELNIEVIGGISHLNSIAQFSQANYQALIALY